MIFKFHKLISPILITAILFIGISCNHDDTISYNHFKINDNIYKIEMFSIFIYAMNDSTDMMWFNFYDDNIEISQTDSVLFTNQFTNGMNYISFQNCSFSNEIKNGKYLVGTNNTEGSGGIGYGYPPYPVGNFHFGEVGQDFSNSNENFDTRTIIWSGNLTVDTDGVNYKIEFNCVGLGGSEIYGYFNGKPSEFIQRK